MYLFLFSDLLLKKNNFLFSAEIFNLVSYPPAYVNIAISDNSNLGIPPLLCFYFILFLSFSFMLLCFLVYLDIFTMD